MTLRSEWTAIAARIEGFLTSTSMYLQALTASRDDPYGGADKVLLPESHRIFEELRGFEVRHSGALSPAAQETLKRFLTDHKEHFKPGLREGWQGIKLVAPALGGVRSEISFHLADFAATARKLSERAFVHLQRSIVVDEQVRTNWNLAFKSGETSCERLGAIHLLSHGIWAFKVDAVVGERTDLVFSDRSIEQPEVESAAEALVLTEWKRVTSPGARVAKAAEARAQAARYTAGGLAGIELASYRYLVLVSKKHLEPLEDVSEGDVIYRHINIAVDPSVPSKA